MDQGPAPPVAPSERLPTRSRQRHKAVTLGILAFAVGIGLVLLRGNVLVERFAKPRIEEAFAKAHPGAKLEIRSFRYRALQNQVIWSGLSLSGPHSSWSCQIDRGEAAGLSWTDLLFGGQQLSAFSRSVWSIDGLSFTFPNSEYRIRCGQLRFSSSDSSLTVEGIELRPALEDEAFFKARDFRRSRLEWKVPRAAIVGIDTAALVSQKVIRAQHVELANATLDTLTSREKPVNPKRRPTKTVSQFLADLPWSIAIDKVTVTNGQVSVHQRLGPGKEPGSMSFDAVQLAMLGFANRGRPEDPILIQGECAFMGQGILKLEMTIPTASRDLALLYSGSLGRVRLPDLNSFLAVTAGTRLESGILYEATFNANVIAGHASGEFQAAYENLDIALLNRQTGSENGVMNKLKSFVADHIVVHTDNMPGNTKPMKAGRIDYTCKSDEKFFHFIWFAVRSGMLDLLGLSDFVKTAH